jgi:hypothetical protein
MACHPERSEGSLCAFACDNSNHIPQTGWPYRDDEIRGPLVADTLTIESNFGCRTLWFLRVRV